MTRLFCLTLVVALASGFPIPAQPKKDPPKNFTNSIGMKFAWIPPGMFIMGSPKEEKGRDDGEIQHKVTLTKGFYMGVYTVTQGQWQAVMGKNPSINNPYILKGEEKNLPVNTVSWDDCQEFIKKLREKDKKPYRLPTEAEWEYACRAGTTTPFHFGKTISTDQANYNGLETYGTGKKGKSRGKPTPWGVSQPMPGGFTICTAMWISGVRIGTVITHKWTWLIRKDQKKVETVCCVAVLGFTVLFAPARPSVAGTYPTTVTSSSVCGSVSSWNE